MRILFTGASSFTGCWFATALSAAGHSVRAVFTRPDASAYDEKIRNLRVRRVASMCEPLFACRFGDDRFLDAVRHETFDLVCHHAADVKDYRSPNFDVCRAVANNTHRTQAVVEALAKKDETALVVTGSFFEGGEGAGSDGLPHLSSYGLSKAISWQIIEHYCRLVGVTCGKFVIPNPFGPLEEPRFTAYLMRTWREGGVAKVSTPSYVRDNIHVSLLAIAYVAFAERVSEASGIIRHNPSGYAESQGAFAERVATEVRDRTDWKCALKHAHQTEFGEPYARMNTEPLAAESLGWSEAQAWQEFVDYYRSDQPFMD